MVLVDVLSLLAKVLVQITKPTGRAERAQERRERGGPAERKKDVSGERTVGAADTVLAVRLERHQSARMARNEEKAMSMLNRWLRVQSGEEFRKEERLSLIHI